MTETEKGTQPGTPAGLEATMRDGTILRADAYRPPGAGPWPVLLARTPYGKRDPGVLARLDPLRTAARGHLVIVQDCRGRFRSDGDWTPLAHEGADGYDTIRWAAQLPGSNGRVCTYGPSYLGHTQWAAIGAKPPELLAAIPEFTWSTPHDGLVQRGGAYELGLMTQWTLSLGQNVLARRHADNPAELKRQLTALNAAIENLTSSTYWELPVGAPLRRLNLPVPAPNDGQCPDTVTVPTLTVAGWYDSFLQGSLDNYVNTRSSGSRAALIIGPWTHDNQTSRIGDVDFGSAADSASIDGGRSLLDRELDWLDQLNSSDQHGPAEDLPVLLFVMGANRWRRLPDWPPEAVEVPWYLHEGARLSPEPPPPNSPPDVFVHDPHNPVPTCGGPLLLTPDFPSGPFDQRQIEAREDVLVYTSTPLHAALEVIGRIRLHLVAASTEDSTDWVARLCDVDTDGVSRNITDGVIRTTQPAGNWAVDLWSTAHTFLPGHRMRLQITSSCFPRWDRNVGAAARQTVHHDAMRPSRLILPVI